MYNLYYCIKDFTRLVEYVGPGRVGFSLHLDGKSTLYIIIVIYNDTAVVATAWISTTDKNKIVYTQT